MSASDGGKIRLRTFKPNYRMTEASRDITSEGLAFLYTLNDLEMMHTTLGSDCLKVCMLKYFKDREFLNRRSAEIFADAAKALGKPVKEVGDGICSAVDRMWQGYDFQKLSEKYGIGESLDFKEKPKAVELIRVFCELALKNYLSLISK